MEERGGKFAFVAARNAVGGKNKKKRTRERRRSGRGRGKKGEEKKWKRRKKNKLEKPCNPTMPRLMNISAAFVLYFIEIHSQLSSSPPPVSSFLATRALAYR